MHALKSATARGLVVSALAIAATGCGGPLTYSPHGTPRAPECDGHITATINNQQANTTVSINVEHLAPPDRIQAGGAAFVAWERRDQNAQWLRIGTLAYNPSDRTGQLQATAPDAAFELSITVENSPAPASPSANIILDQRVGTESRQNNNNNANAQQSAAPQS